jgi:hypothetical protein
MIRTGSVAEIPLRFCSFYLRFLSRNTCQALCSFDSENDGLVTVPQIRRAFGAIDPCKPPEVRY